MTNEQKRSDILQRLAGIFRTVFDDDGIELSESTSALDIPDWDSLSHVTLCVTIERAFNVKLNAAEIARFGNVGDLVTLLAGKTG